MTGLAHDGGLFVPDTMPSVTKDELESWRGLSFPDLAVNVISKFVKEDQVPTEILEDIIKRSCAAFRSEEVTPVVNVGGHKILVSSETKMSKEDNSESLKKSLYPIFSQAILSHRSRRRLL